MSNLRSLDRLPFHGDDILHPPNIRAFEWGKEVSSIHGQQATEIVLDVRMRYSLVDLALRAVTGSQRLRSYLAKIRSSAVGVHNQPYIKKNYKILFKKLAVSRSNIQFNYLTS